MSNPQRVKRQLQKRICDTAELLAFFLLPLI